ncbi:MAG: YcgN family cysteine cluster protein [Chromatiales bacterium]|nr:YcgN family cysteine cluster protein [Chromatiales bacterium]
MSNPFWERPLEELNRDEWEQLCDGCARCCLIQLEDEESQEIITTSVACQYLERESCSCSVYLERRKLVPECWQVTVENISQLHWMPMTCAYRLRAEGRPLPDWHPLISGDPNSVHEAGISVKHLATLESELPQDAELEDYSL